jgi:hypothetical protein
MAGRRSFVRTSTARHCAPAESVGCLGSRLVGEREPPGNPNTGRFGNRVLEARTGGKRLPLLKIAAHCDDRARRLADSQHDGTPTRCPVAAITLRPGPLRIAGDQIAQRHPTFRDGALANSGAAFGSPFLYRERTGPNRQGAGSGWDPR